jgi:formyltetrahydrofolate-dependent phosphoribosylglycinamide formyltransferase
MEKQTIRLAVLLSGAGRTLQNLIDRIRDGTLPAKIRLVVSSSPKTYGLERAKKQGLPVKVVPFRKGEEARFSRTITEALDAAGTDLVCLAGFIHLYHIPSPYQERVINIHPALLPKFGGKGFYGMNVHRAVIAAGEKESGCTVHVADNRYDHGPIILQRKVPVPAGDTPEALAERVFKEECIAYPEAIRLFAEGRVRLRDGRVEVIP